jgi:hypothetical protein
MTLPSKKGESGAAAGTSTIHSQLLAAKVDSSVETSDKCTEEGEYITDMKSTRICKNALLEVIGQSKTRAKQNTVPGHHKLKGKPSNRRTPFNFHFGDALIDHFENLRFVTLRADTDDDKAQYLPPNVTKSGCYAAFCLGRGVKIRTDKRGNTIKTPADDRTHVDNVPAFSSYLSFWNTEYKDLKVSVPAEHDICGAHC